MATQTTLGSVATEPVAAAPAVAPPVDAGKVDAKPVDGKASEVALTPEQQKVEADKVATEAAAKPFTDAAQLNLAEGMKLDEVLMKDFVPLAKEHGFTAKQAQALIEFNAKARAAAETAKQASQESARKASVEALKNDKEIGGAKWPESKALVARALSTIGSPELNEALNSMQLADGTMLGDNIVFARMLVNLGRKVAEDSTKDTHSSGAAKTAANDPTTLHKSMYPHPTSTKSLKY